METVKDLLDKYKIEKQKSKRPVNLRFERAREFAEYVGLKPTFVLRLFKTYGEDTVLGLRSWLKDCPHDPQRYAGLVVWKLKELEKLKKT